MMTGNVDSLQLVDTSSSIEEAVGSNPTMHTSFNNTRRSMAKKDYRAITVMASPVDESVMIALVDADFIAEYGGQFINGEYYPPLKNDVLQLDQQLQQQRKTLKK
jgi:hypothetical protein